MTRRERRRPAADDRRDHRRVPARLLPSLSAHLSGGSGVTLLDLSQGGVRLETTRHMRPGQTVSLRFKVDARLITINATVVRSAVTGLDAEEVRYETGLRLSDELSCDQLQLALVERRVATAGDIPDDLECPEPYVFASIDDEAGNVDTSRGWWLASARRRRQRVVNNY